MSFSNKDIKIIKLQKHIPVFVLDDKNEVLGVSAEFSKLTGFKSKEIKTRKIFGLLSKGSLRGFNQLLS
ncbi:MAG: PAS domain-containing protein, partial [Bacteroidota bacterium]